MRRPIWTPANYSSGAEFPHLIYKFQRKSKSSYLWTEWTQWTQLGWLWYSVHLVHSVQWVRGVYFYTVSTSEFPRLSCKFHDKIKFSDLWTQWTELRQRGYSVHLVHSVHKESGVFLHRLPVPAYPHRARLSRQM